MEQAFYLAFLAIASEILGTVGGFGSSLFFVPLAQIFLPFHLVLALTGILHVFGNINKIVLFFRHIDRKLAVWFMVPTLIAVIIGSLLTEYINPDFLEVFTGIFLVAFSLFMLFNPDFVLSPKKPFLVLGAGLSGFLTGLIGSGGAIRGITMAAYQLNKNTFIGTNALIDILNDSTRTVIYISQGYLEKDYFFYIPILFFSALIGSYAGKEIVKRISQNRFQKIVLLFVAAIGFWMIWEHRSLLLN